MSSFIWFPYPKASGPVLNREKPGNETHSRRPRPKLDAFHHLSKPPLKD
ncbi:hypothetical protein COLO4_38058 [Corchorus olitorius]|uniref:Uncharacterized protein n=1 Tax=Corchorus olitorius TaxID=93759 RepID=A0A1R3FXE8_9ROSI|nr:hypothetical protein COLO4_38058 [Corchorus olitorius]